MRLSDDEVAEALHEHGEWVQDRLDLWERFNKAYSSKFWQGGDPWGGKLPTSGDNSLPIKISTNRIFGQVQRYISHLYFRAPRAEVNMPGVLEGARGRGRPKSLGELPSKASALLNEFLARSDAQEAGTYALQLALFHGASAYKLTPNRRGKRVLDAYGVSVVPRWDVLWDDRETAFDQQLYRGHVRYERIDWVHEVLSPIVKADLRKLVPDNEATYLPGPFGQEWDPERRRRPRRYVRILEWYDLLDDVDGTGGALCYYLVKGHRNPSIVPLGERLPLPYPQPNGRPGVPLVPVVIAHEPSRPLAGLSVVERMYYFNAELNLMLSIIANAMRRDACRYNLVHKGVLGPDAIEKIRRAEDGEVIEIDRSQAPDLGKVFQTFQLPQFGQSLDKYRQWLYDEESATSGISDIMAGKQGNYLSATEAEFLASAGEASALEVGARLTQALARLSELGLSAFAARKTDLQVRLPSGDYVNLSPEELDEPLVVDIVDAASTPMQRAKRQTGFLAVQKLLSELVAVASSPDELPGPDGQPVPNTITPEQREMAIAQIEYIVTQWDLPETLGWDMISGQGETQKKALKKEAKERVLKLLDAKAAEMEGQGPALPPPQIPAFPG